MDGIDDLLRANRRAGVAEVCWTDESGTPRATAVVPLQHGGRPALALLWSQWPAARELAACPGVAWVLSDRRMSQRDWEPVAAVGRLRLVVDDDGSVFGESMLDQELRKHPPSRAFMDSPVLRREHWWFVPRLILLLEPTAIHPVAERTDPERHGVLAVAAGEGRVSVDTVSVDTTGEGFASCTSLAGRELPAAGAAALLVHDFSVPDLERWGRRVTVGTFEGARLHGWSPSEAATIPPVPGLRERVRRHRDLERQCRSALRARPPA